VRRRWAAPRRQARRRRQERCDIGEDREGHDERPVCTSRRQRADGRPPQRFIGDDQGLRLAKARHVHLDDMLAFEHAPAGLAPIARRRDESRRFTQARIVARRDVLHVG
jgi:hypothetical protein